MHCASLGYDTAHLAHLRSALAERGGTADHAGRWGANARSDTEINERDMLEDPLFWIFVLSCCDDRIWTDLADADDDDIDVLAAAKRCLAGSRTIVESASKRRSAPDVFLNRILKQILWVHFLIGKSLERTKAAIAERQKFSALMKMLRAGLM